MIHQKSHIDQHVKKWFAVHTKYKTEKLVAERLNRKGILAYVPLINHVKRYSRKIKECRIPLIHCYVFVFISKEEYVKVLETEYVKGFLKINRSLIAIPEMEIELLRKIVGEYEDIQVFRSDYTEGQEVEVIQGNMTGMRGKLISIEGKHEFVIDLKIISYQFRIHIDPKYLRPIRELSLV